MKSIRLTIILSIFLLSSCSDEPKKTELESKIETINKSQPKQTEVVNKPVATAKTPKYKLGKHYELLSKPYPTNNSENVVVYEFFGYTCPHCFHFEPYLNKWLETKADYVSYERVSLNFNPSWSVYQQAYLTAQTMGIDDEAHTKLFEAIHNKHKRFNTIDELAKWYADNYDVDEEAFISTADSFIIDSQQRKADKMGFEMGVTATPALIINGKYKISKKIRDRDEMISIMRFVASLEAKEMGLITD